MNTNDREEIKKAFALTKGVVRRPKMLALLGVGCVLFLCFEGTLFTLPAFAIMLLVIIFWICLQTVRDGRRKSKLSLN